MMECRTANRPEIKGERSGAGGLTEARVARCLSWSHSFPLGQWELTPLGQRVFFFLFAGLRQTQSGSSFSSVEEFSFRD